MHHAMLLQLFTILTAINFAESNHGQHYEHTQQGWNSWIDPPIPRTYTSTITVQITTCLSQTLTNTTLPPSPTPRPQSSSTPSQPPKSTLSCANTPSQTPTPRLFVYTPSEVVQTYTDCGLIASIYAILTFDPCILRSLFTSVNPGSATINLYDQKSSPKTYTVSINTTSTWITALEAAYIQHATAEGWEDPRTIGVAPFNAFQAIYGPRQDLVTVGCQSLNDVIADATRFPSVFGTKEGTGHLTDRHAYTILSRNETHVRLRNPWGFASAVGQGIVDLGGGEMDVTMDVLREDCGWLDLVNLHGTGGG